MKSIVEMSVLPIVLKNAELKTPFVPLLKPIVGNGYSDKSAFTNKRTNAVLKN